MISRSLFGLGLCAFALCQAQHNVYDIRKYGAKVGRELSASVRKDAICWNSALMCMTWQWLALLALLALHATPAA